MKPKVHRTNHWYRIRLGKYFDEHYVEYEDSITWYTDPAPNQWVFNIPELKTRVELTCDVKGNISVVNYPLKGVDRP